MLIAFFHVVMISWCALFTSGNAMADGRRPGWPGRAVGGPVPSASQLTAFLRASMGSFVRHTLLLLNLQASFAD